jgi:hypothetical protein
MDVVVKRKIPAPTGNQILVVKPVNYIILNFSTSGKASTQRKAHSKDDYKVVRGLILSRSGEGQKKS